MQGQPPTGQELLLSLGIALLFLTPLWYRSALWLSETMAAWCLGDPLRPPTSPSARTEALMPPRNSEKPATVTWWEHNVAHSRHNTSGIHFTDDCAVCMGTVREAGQTLEDFDMGKKKNKPQAGDAPRRAILRADTYSREPEHTEDDVHDAIAIVATISHPEAAKHAVKVVTEWL